MTTSLAKYLYGARQQYQNHIERSHEQSTEKLTRPIRELNEVPQNLHEQSTSSTKFIDSQLQNTSVFAWRIVNSVIYNCSLSMSVVWVNNTGAGVGNWIANKLGNSSIFSMRELIPECQPEDLPPPLDDLPFNDPFGEIDRNIPEGCVVDVFLACHRILKFTREYERSPGEWLPDILSLIEDEESMAVHPGTGVSPQFIHPELYGQTYNQYNGSLYTEGRPYGNSFPFGGILDLQKPYEKGSLKLHRFYLLSYRQKHGQTTKQIRKKFYEMFDKERYPDQIPIEKYTIDSRILRCNIPPTEPIDWKKPREPRKPKPPKPPKNINDDNEDECMSCNCWQLNAILAAQAASTAACVGATVASGLKTDALITTQLVTGIAALSTLISTQVLGATTTLTTIGVNTRFTVNTIEGLLKSDIEGKIRQKNYDTSPDMEIDYKGKGIEGLSSKLTAISEQINLLNKQLIDHPIIAPIPDEWQIKAEAKRPQYVCTFREFKDDKLLKSSYTICIPHVVGTKPDGNNRIFSDYSKGDFMGMQKLKDNSQIIVNCISSEECLRVIEELIKVVKPEYLLNSQGERIKPRIIPRPDTLKKFTSRLVRIDYYPSGREKVRPEWSKRYY